MGVKLNGAPLHTESIAFTESYDNGDTVEFKFTNFVPSFAPSGTYGLTFQFVDKAGKNNGCLSFQFKLWFTQINLIVYSFDHSSSIIF